MMKIGRRAMKKTKSYIFKILPGQIEHIDAVQKSFSSLDPLESEESIPEQIEMEENLTEATAKWQSKPDAELEEEAEFHSGVEETQAEPSEEAEAERKAKRSAKSNSKRSDKSKSKRSAKSRAEIDPSEEAGGRVKERSAKSKPDAELEEEAEAELEETQAEPLEETEAERKARRSAKSKSKRSTKSRAESDPSEEVGGTVKPEGEAERSAKSSAMAAKKEAEEIESKTNAKAERSVRLMAEPSVKSKADSGTNSYQAKEGRQVFGQHPSVNAEVVFEESHGHFAKQPERKDRNVGAVRGVGGSALSEATLQSASEGVEPKRTSDKSEGWYPPRAKGGAGARAGDGSGGIVEVCCRESKNEVSRQRSQL
jgi:hypothetical protein